MTEISGQFKKYFKIKFVITDIDAGAIAADVSPVRLKRFFIKEENSYKIKKQIRDMVVFANQNIIKDPPFSKSHLVSYRNLLIYLDQVLQN